MPKRQGYCSYCHMQYSNLEQHLFSAQHRNLTRQSRRRPYFSGLMERFLQDVMRHHPHYDQEEDGSAENENPESPDVVFLDEFIPEDLDDDDDDDYFDFDDDTDTDSCDEFFSDVSDTESSVEDIDFEPSDPQECERELAIRPSVIQKLEKGQQQSLEFGYRVESGMESSVDGGQGTSSGKSIIRPPVICNAPASCLPSCSYDRGVTASTSSSRLVLAIASESFPSCDTDPAEPEEDPTPSSHDQENQPAKQPLCLDLDKLIAQNNLRATGTDFTPAVRFRELRNAMLAVRVESSSEEEDEAAGPSYTEAPPAAAEHCEDLHSDLYAAEEEYPALLPQQCLVSSEMDGDDSDQLASVPPQWAVQDLCLCQEDEDEDEDEEEEEEEEEELDDDAESCGSEISDMSFDCGSSCNSLFAVSELFDSETSDSDDTDDDLQSSNNTSNASGTPSASASSDSVQEIASDSQVIAEEEVRLQNTKRTSLVDESYDSSSSEMNFDAGASSQSTQDCPPKPATAVNLSKREHSHLVDPSYGSSSQSEGGDESTSAGGEPPVVRRKRLRKKAHASLVDESYGSSSSEASSDTDTSLDRPQTSAKGRKMKGRPVHLKHKKRKFSNAKAHLDCDVSLETVADEPGRNVEDINLLKEKNADLVDMNCESHGPEMGFHADAQLVADESQVAVKEVNHQEVDIDLDNESVRSSISNLSFDAFLDQSANDQPQGALGELNLNELNVDMEVKSNGCSSSELTFDSDSPLLSVSERSQLDVERLCEDGINVEDESCESSSSDITFDSDIPNCSVVGQPEVAVNEEKPVDLENKSNESCVSEITFDSDIPPHSGNDPPEVAVGVVTQEEEHAHLARNSDTPSDSQLSSDSLAPLHSGTSPTEVTVQKMHSQKEDQAHTRNDSEPPNSELSVDYDSFYPKTGHLEDPTNDINFQKEQHVHLENKSNELSVSETRLNCDIPPFQSVIRKCEVIVKNTWLQKEKHAELQGTCAEFRDSEVSSDSSVSHAVTEPQLPVLKEDHIDPEGESTELRGFQTNFNIDDCLHPVIDQPQLNFLKEKHDLKDNNDQPSYSHTTFSSVLAHLQSLTERHLEVIKKMNLWQEESISLENKINESNGSKVLYDSDVSSHSSVDQLEVAIKQINLENKEQMCLGNKNNQCNYSETNLDSDFLVQSIGDQPKVTTLEPEHIELEAKHGHLCDSDDSLQSAADQPSETNTNISPWKEKDIELESKRDKAKDFGITYDCEVLQPVACHTEVIQINHWKEHVDLEDKIVECSVSKVNFSSDELVHSVTNTTQEPLKEMNAPREEHASLNNKGYEPHGSGIIYGTNVSLHSVIQPPQTLQKRHASLEVSNGDPYPEMNFDSNDPCQSRTGHLPKTVKEMNLKEDHIYLEDKSYRLVDFEASYDSDDPVQFVTDPSVVNESVKEVNSPKQDQSDLENENYQPCSSGLSYDSSVHLQSEVDPFQVAQKETNLQKEAFLDMEEKSNESSDSEMYASDVSFQIVVNQCQTSDGEADSPQLVFVDVASDSDCDREVISDPHISLQLETDPPQMTIRETDDAEPTGSTLVGNHHCEFCGCKLRYDYESSLQSVTNQSKESFKIINRKNDYIILGDSTCQSCGHEINFNIDSSDPSMTYQSQGPDQNYIDPENRSCESNYLGENFNSEDTSQPVTQQLQKPNEEADLGEEVRDVGLQDKNWESNVCAVNRAAFTVSVIRQTRQPDVENVSYQSCDSRLAFQHDASLQSYTAHPQEVVKKIRQRKRVTFDRRVKSYVIPSSDSTYIFDSRSNLEQIEFMEDDPDEPVLEALPHIPPCEDKTWPQMQEDGSDSNTKNALLDEGTPPWSDFSQDTVSVQYPPDQEDSRGSTEGVDDFPGISGRPCSPSQAEGLHTQHWHVASQSQTATVSHETQSSCSKHMLKKRKMTGQEETPPKRKHLESGSKEGKRAQFQTAEVSASQTEILEAPSLDSLISAFNSLSIKPKESKSFNSPKMKHCSSDDNSQILYTCKADNLNGPLRKNTVIKPPQNQIKPDLYKCEMIDIDLSRNDLSVEENAGNRQNLASTSFMTTPERSVLHRTSQPYAFRETSKNVNASEIPKENFQLTLSSHDGAKISSQSVRSEFCKKKSKKNIWTRKTTSKKSHFTKNAYKEVTHQQESRLAAEKLAIWTQIKASDIIRKYVSRFSGVLCPVRHPSRTTLARMQLRQSLARSIQEAEGPPEALVNSSAPPAGAEEHVVAVAGPSHQPVESLSSTAGIKHGTKKYRRRKKRLITPVREYDLRSSCYIPDSDRMVTRLASKLRSNEVK